MSSCFAPEQERRLRPISVRYMDLCCYAKRSTQLGLCIRVQQMYQGVAAVKIAISNWGTEIPLSGEEAGGGVCQKIEHGIHKS